MESPTAVEQENDLLVALILVLARDGLAEARGRLPIDLPKRVAVAALAQLVKLKAFAPSTIRRMPRLPARFSAARSS